MQILNKKRMAMVAIVLVLLYLGYRIHDARSYAAMLRETTLNAIAPPVSILSLQPVQATESITLPGTIVRC